MNTGIGPLQRLEQRMTYVRWFGVFLAIVLVVLEQDFPDDATRFRAWFMTGILAVGSFFIWGASGRTGDVASHKRLGLASFVFDGAVVMGFVWVFAFGEPYIGWALLFLIPMEGALRYRMAGAFAGAASVTVFFVAQSMNVAELKNEQFDVITYVFVVGMSVLIAGITGSMANQWRAQSVALEHKSLKLAEVDQLKDRFLAITSHEIRGPLTAIIAGVDTVRKRLENLTPEQHDRLLEMVASQGHQLARLVDDLQITSQIQSNQLALHPAWTDLERNINQALEAAAAKRRHHQLEVFVEPIECFVDASRIGQIVRNLVENAYKYTPDRTRVAVTAEREGGGIQIEVTDDGPGIPAEKRDKLFEAFTRIEETSAGQEGVGLGLYVVSQLVAAMKGRIDIASSARGTSFTIEIPCDAREVTVEGPRLDLVRDEEGSARA
ncbi:MAG: sensor histidine kinase [Actinomycetota bacterium]